MSDSSRTFLGSTAFSATLLAAALAVCGYFFQEGFGAIAQLQRAESELTSSLSLLKDQFNRVVAQTEALHRTVFELDRRVTRREDNQFTPQEGMKLQLQVSEHSTLISQQSHTLADLREELKSIREGVQKVWGAIRESREDSAR